MRSRAMSYLKNFYVTTPIGTDIFKVAGGGQNYVHGGSSLQEMLIPVIEVTTNAKFVAYNYVDVVLTSTNRKVTNLITYFDFIQTEKVTDTMKARSLVGALIAIVPSITEKLISNKYEHKEKQQQEKQELYIELISLFSRVLKENRTERDLLLLRNKINLISITGSVEVVKALNEYINTWGRASGEVQNEKYRTLLQVMRKDLNVDKKIDEDFPSIGLCDINVKR